MSETEIIESMNSARPARSVLLVEDQTPIRTLLTDSLSQAGFKVTACDSAKRAIAIFPSLDPDLLIADIDLGSRPNGVELATILRTRSPYLGLLFLTNYPSLRAFERTITPPQNYAFLQKDLMDSTDRLLDVIESALSGLKAPRLDIANLSQSPIFSLTSAQLQILRMVASGLTNGQIAKQRESSLRAVEKMIERIYRSLGLAEVTGAHQRILAANLYTRTYGYPSLEGWD